MARKKLEITDKYPYHTLARTNRKEWFLLHPQLCWEIYESALKKMSDKYGTIIHAFVLMSNHFHLVISTTTHDLGFVMNRFMTETSQEINFYSKTENHVYGGRHKPTIIKSSFHYGNAIKYVYRNPVKAGICKSIQDYSYSTINDELLKTKFKFEVQHHAFSEIFPDEQSEYLKWLNTPFLKEDDEKIKKALYRTVFKINSRGKTKTDINYKLG